MTLLERLHAQIEYDTASGCWLWSGSQLPGGYGRLSVGGRGGRRIRTHRIAYEQYVGAIPEGLAVCHRCDVPACCNPAHLFLGTQAENMADMGRKGRARGFTAEACRGERNRAAKLSDSDALEIRRRHLAGETQQALGRAYGVSRSAICLVTLGKNFRHVDGPTIKHFDRHPQ